MRVFLVAYFIFYNLIMENARQILLRKLVAQYKDAMSSDTSTHEEYAKAMDRISIQAQKIGMTLDDVFEITYPEYVIN